ncbi:MAG: hypothetical protein Q7S31_02135 [bacterium]|nr:hypothetical protein [bacterium]
MNVNLTPEFKSRLEGLFIGVLQDPPTAPPPYNPLQAEAMIWEFCRSLLTEEELKPVEKILDHNQKLLALNLAILKKMADLQASSLPENMAELLEAYDKHLAQEKQEAEAKIRLKPEIHQQVQQAIETYRKNLAILSPEAALVVEAAQTELVLQLETETPEVVIPRLNTLATQLAGQAGQVISETQAILALEPVVVTLAQTHIQTGNLFHTAAAISGQEPAAAQTIAAAAVVAKINNYTPAKTVAVLEALVPPLEAITRKPISLPSNQISQTISNFNYRATGEELIRQTYEAVLKKEGMESPVSEEMAQILIDLRTHTIGIAVSRYATEPEASPEQSRQNKLAAFKSVNNAALQYLSTAGSPKARAQQMIEMATRVDWEAVYQVTESYYPMGDVVAVQEFYLRKSKSAGTSPLMGFLLGQGRSYAANKITQKAVGGAAKWAAEKGLIKAAAVAAAPETAGASLVAAAVAQAVSWAKDVGSWALRKIKDNWQMLAVGGLTLGGAAIAGFSAPVVAAAGMAGGAVGVAASPGGLTKVGSKATQIFNGVTGLAVVEIATPLLVITLTVPIVVVLILFIINNSAYIVPQATGTVGLGGVGSSVGCFTFEGFDDAELQVMNAAAQTIASQSCYNGKLCEKGPIRVINLNQNRCYGGYAESQNRTIYLYETGFRQIVSGVSGCTAGGFSAFNALYTLAHESGHVYAAANPEYGTNYAALNLPLSDGSCLPTYSLYNNNNPVACQIDSPGGPILARGEDLAETIADHFSFPEVLANFPVHTQLANTVFNSCSP